MGWSIQMCEREYWGFLSFCLTTLLSGKRQAILFKFISGTSYSTPCFYHSSFVIWWAQYYINSAHKWNGQTQFYAKFASLISSSHWIFTFCKYVDKNIDICIILPKLRFYFFVAIIKMYLFVLPFSPHSLRQPYC